jgi:hypothetical protein
MCESNFQWCSSVLTCMWNLVWYFMMHGSVVVIKILSIVFCLVKINKPSRNIILAWIQFLCVMHCDIFPEQPLVHFTNVQRISENYLCILVIVATIKIHRKLTTRYFGVNPIFWIQELFIYLLVCWVCVLTKLGTRMFVWCELGFLGYIKIP